MEELEIAIKFTQDHCSTQLFRAKPPLQHVQMSCHSNTCLVSLESCTPNQHHLNHVYN